VLTAAFEARGYRVQVASTGREAAHLARILTPDLVILDLGLPDVDGLDLCRHLRALLRCPIVVVTAEAFEGRIVEALDLGADDYVIKPFSMPVLLARIRMAMRHYAATAAIVEDQILEAGDVRVDVGAHQVMIGGELVDFQARPFALLVVLMRNPDKVLTYAALAKALGPGPAGEIDRNGWRILVSKIRKQLGTGSERPTIVTDLNVGYRLTVPNDPFEL